MAFVVEDGTGLTTANSYATVAYADDYFATRMSPNWPAPPAEGDDPNTNLKQACLVSATDFIDFYWRSQFKGIKCTYAQRLAWPRIGATVDEGSGLNYWPGYGNSAVDGFLISNTTLPEMLTMCCAELASRAYIMGLPKGAPTSPGQLAPDITEDAFIESETIGPLSTHYKDKPVATIYRFCEMLLAPILQMGGGSMVRLSRG